MDLLNKLSILADAAKYDASCASSGAESRNSLKSGGIGSAGGMGICHSYAPDGRCISLLKILLTNFCIYECSYCVNRSSSGVQRARFTVDEVVNLTLDFYKRNYIEGLFLSSGIIQNADYTMEEVVAVARKLRLEHRFNGYIHLKTIPEASQELLTEAGLYADRLSINVELPTEEGLQNLAPEKNAKHIEHTMLRVKEGINNYKYEKKQSLKTSTQRSKPKKFSPSGQSTQMIVGADNASDWAILNKSDALYGRYRLKRVYYSAFSPIPHASSLLPVSPPPLVREHRLYQADWLIRLYGYQLRELKSSLGNTQMLDLNVDPKLAWALANREQFPVNLNTADYEMILRVPGIGLLTARKIIQQRKSHRAITLEDLSRFRINLEKIKPFVVTQNYQPATEPDSSYLYQSLSEKHHQQLSLF